MAKEFYQGRIGIQVRESAKQLNAKNFDENSAGILDQLSRTSPTKLHYAAASLGAWMGREINLQYLSHYATDPQIGRWSKQVARILAFGRAVNRSQFPMLHLVQAAAMQ